MNAAWRFAQFPLKRSRRARLVWLVALLLVTCQSVGDPPLPSPGQRVGNSVVTQRDEPVAGALTPVVSPADPETTYWRRISPTPEFHPQLLFAPSDDRVLYARDRLTNRLFHSTDRGDTWRELALSANVEIGSTLAALPANLTVAERESSPEPTSVVVAGSGVSTGLLFKISDTGAVDQLNADPFRLIDPWRGPVVAPVVGLFVHPKAPDRWLANVALGENEARIGAAWTTIDGGHTWSVWQTGWHTLAVDPNDPDVIFMQSTEQTKLGFVEAPVAKTGDGGLSWRSLSSAVGTNVIGLWLAPSDSQTVYLLRSRESRTPPNSASFEGYFSTNGGEGDEQWNKLWFQMYGMPVQMGAVAVDPQQSSGLLISSYSPGVAYRSDHSRNGAWRSLSLGAGVERPGDVYFDRSGDYMYFSHATVGLYRRQFDRLYPSARLTDCSTETLDAKRAPPGTPASLLRELGYFVAPSDDRYHYWLHRTGADTAILERSTDGGASWSAVELDFPGYTALGVDLWDPERLYLGVTRPDMSKPIAPGTWSRYGVLYVSVAGASPTPLNQELMKIGSSTSATVAQLAGLYQFAARPDLMIVQTRTGSVRSRPDLFVSRDGGQTWKLWLASGAGSVIDPQSPRAFLAFKNDMPSDMYPNAALLRTTDDGVTWSTFLEGRAWLSLAVHPITHNMFLVNYHQWYHNGSILRSPDNGITWQRTTRTPVGQTFQEAGGPIIFDPAIPDAMLALYRRAWTPDGGATWYPVTTVRLPNGEPPYRAVFDQRGEFLWQPIGFGAGFLRCRFERPMSFTVATSDILKAPPHFRAAHLDRYTTPAPPP